MEWRKDVVHRLLAATYWSGRRTPFSLRLRRHYKGAVVRWR